MGSSVSSLHFCMKCFVFPSSWRVLGKYICSRSLSSQCRATDTCCISVGRRTLCSEDVLLNTWGSRRQNVCFELPQMSCSRLRAFLNRGARCELLSVWELTATFWLLVYVFMCEALLENYLVDKARQNMVHAMYITPGSFFSLTVFV